MAFPISIPTTAATTTSSPPWQFSFITLTGVHRSEQDTSKSASRQTEDRQKKWRQGEHEACKVTVGRSGSQKEKDIDEEGEEGEEEE